LFLANCLTSSVEDKYLKILNFGVKRNIAKSASLTIQTYMLGIRIK